MSAMTISTRWSVSIDGSYPTMFASKRKDAKAMVAKCLGVGSLGPSRSPNGFKSYYYEVRGHIVLIQRDHSRL